MRSDLRTFLVQHRELIEQRTLDVFFARSKPAPPESALHRGIPIFMEQLVETLSRGDKDEGKTDDSEIAKTARDYGQRLFGLGFTVSELVHGYGSVCAVVTELAGEVRLEISTSEFEVFNRVLDVAIAESVTAHEYARASETAQRESVRIGALAHELRNALSAATMALRLLKEGTVAPRGPTANVLDRNLARMGVLIDRSLAEVRLGTDSEPVPERFRLADALDEIKAIAQYEANRRKLELVIDVDRALELETDIQFFMSAVSNLVQNALKYTREGSHVSVRGHRKGDNLVIEVEDECGGLPPGGGEGLLRPFVRGTHQTAGVGLGLSIAARAIKAVGGELRIRDLPGKGCIFLVELPCVFPAGQRAHGPKP